MMFLRPAVGLAAWCAYSVVQRRALMRRVWPNLQLISETRQPNGNLTRILEDSSFRTVSSVPKGWVHVRGNITNANGDSTIIATKNLACCIENNSKLYGLWARTPLERWSLRDLVTESQLSALIIFEDVNQRLEWMRHIDDCTVQGSLPLSGNYSFCMRDYVNYEEVLGCMCRRWGIERLLFRPRRPGRVTIDKGQCRIVELGAMLGFVPVEIEWEGEVKGSAIDWTHTSLRLGWKRFGKTIDKPPAAEKLRVNPWDIYLPTDDDELESGDVLVFHRRGNGKLVFARDELMAE